LDEPSTNEAPRYSKPAGNLIGRLTPEIGGNDVLGSNVVAPVFDLGPDAIELRLLALRPELNTSLSEPGFDGPIGRAKLSSNLADGLPPDVCLDKIVSVDVGVFEGHVYNLQTESGTYVANGIVSHNCAGVPNIFRRAAGKIIPTRGDALYDGGIAAYFYTPAFGGLGPGFFSGVDVPFNLATAKKWARETGSGVLVGRSYRNNSLAGQGHVAILLPDGKVLQSFQFGADGEPGLNADYTIEESHAGGYYEIMVHPKDWIDHDKGKKFAPDEGEEQKAGGRRDEKGRRDGTDDEPYGPEPVEEFTDEEFEEIGREILQLFSRLRQDRTRRRR